MASNFDIANLREEYGKRGLLESDLDPDPLRQFQKWLEEALAQQLLEPNAMTLATVDASGQPCSRTVLLKGCDARGFSFYTNYESAKGRQLAHEPRCALTFRWGELERQVNVTGRVEKVPRDETAAYFPKRPLGSRVDRHTHIGEGHLGLEPFRRLVNDARFAGLPMLLETPKAEGTFIPRLHLPLPLADAEANPPG